VKGTPFNYAGHAPRARIENDQESDGEIENDHYLAKIWNFKDKKIP
jgi:hypothetical protein